MFSREGAEEACSRCRPAPTQGRFKRVGAWAGILLFCPCHLPLTIAGLLVMLSAAGLPGSAPWIRPLLFALFGASFVSFVVVLLRMAMRRREQDRVQEIEHEAHHGQAAEQKPVPTSVTTRPVPDNA